MKVLFDHPSPFLLAHGGFQIQIEETKRALEKIGITVEFLRWWDSEQRGDIIHFFGRPSGNYIDSAHGKNMSVVMTELLTGLGSRSLTAISMQGLLVRLVRGLLPSPLWERMGWDAHSKADRIVALTEWEAILMRRVFNAPADRLSVIPNGVSEEFLRAGQAKSKRGEYLVCAATITERKRIVELAEAAALAGTPVWIVGQPYSETDGYAQRFFALANQHPEIIRYEGAVQDRQALARIYRAARGFVLLSTQESLSLSALEATACECPLLLSDLPWARQVFKDNAVYCPVASVSDTAKRLREFYDSAPFVVAPSKPLSWVEVAHRLKFIYEEVSSTSW